MSSARDSTLEELEENVWPEPAWDSQAVRGCHALRRKRLSELTVEDVRLGVAQQMGLPGLVPLALEILKASPLAEGAYFPETSSPRRCACLSSSGEKDPFCWLL